MRQGYSWSGRERKCCFLNLGDRSFVDVSAVSGIDYAEDGRAVAVTDWDGDGDLDLWMRFRSGPQLRFLRSDSRRASQSNAGGGAHFLELQLIGRSCNRDAIGAVVTVYAGGRAIKRQVVAGDGYLSQSSKMLHFGLGDISRIDKVELRWPGTITAGGGCAPCVETRAGLSADRCYRITQGDSKLIDLGSRTIVLRDAPADQPAVEAMSRLVLRTPLPFPAELLSAIGHQQPGAAVLQPPAVLQPTLVCLWASWCAPCMGELKLLVAQRERIEQVAAGHFGDSTGRAALRVVLINVDKSEDKIKAREAFDRIMASSRASSAYPWGEMDHLSLDVLDAILLQVRDREGLGTLPLSMLFDQGGALQIVYLGPLNIEVAAADAKQYGRDGVPAHRRFGVAGRWYFDARRSLASLAEELSRRGQKEAAKFYERLSATRRTEN